MRIESGVTDRYIYFVAVDATDLSSRETGLSSFTVYRSRNGGAAAAMTTPTINETDATNMPGVYELLVDEDTTIDAGDDEQEMVFHITHTGMAPVTRTILLYRPKITAGNTLDVTSTGAAGIDWGNVENASTSVDLSATSINLCDTVTTNTDMRGTDSAATAAELAKVPKSDGTATWNATALASINSEVDTALTDIHLDHLFAVDYDPATPPGVATAWANEIVESDAGVTRFTVNALENAPSGSGASAETIADAVWDEARSGHVTAGTFGETMGTVETNIDNCDSPISTAQADLDTITGAAGVLLDSTATSAQLVDDIWDEVLTGAAHNVNNSAAKYLREAREVAGITGTAQAGAATTITLAASDSSNDDIYNSERVSIIEGTGAGQSRLVTDYDGTTKVATVHRAWDTNPDSTSVYNIVGADADMNMIRGSLTAASNLLADYDGTGYNKANSTIGTTTTNTDMLTQANVRSAVGLASADLDTQLAALPTATENADALLNRDMSAVSDTNARSPLNALRFLRNKWAVSGTTLTVNKEDDTTSAWTATVSTDATADPVIGNDPA